MQCAVRSNIARNNVKERREVQVKEEIDRRALENKSAMELQRVFREYHARSMVRKKKR